MDLWKPILQAREMSAPHTLPPKKEAAAPVRHAEAINGGAVQAQSPSSKTNY